jgi:hypothetical protein
MAIEAFDQGVAFLNKALELDPTNACIIQQLKDMQE